VLVALSEKVQFFFELFYADNVAPGLDTRGDGVINMFLVLGRKTGVGATKDGIFILESLVGIREGTMSRKQVIVDVREMTGIRQEIMAGGCRLGHPWSSEDDIWVVVVGEDEGGVQRHGRKKQKKVFTIIYIIYRYLMVQSPSRPTSPPSPSSSETVHSRFVASPVTACNIAAVRPDSL